MVVMGSEAGHSQETWLGLVAALPFGSGLRSGWWLGCKGGVDSCAWVSRVTTEGLVHIPLQATKARGQARAHGFMVLHVILCISGQFLPCAKVLQVARPGNHRGAYRGFSEVALLDFLKDNNGIITFRVRSIVQLCCSFRHNSKTDLSNWTSTHGHGGTTKVQWCRAAQSRATSDALKICSM